MHPQEHRMIRWAMGGALLWALVWLGPALGPSAGTDRLVAHLLLAAPLVLVPCALSLLERRGYAWDPANRIFDILTWTHPIAAVSALTGFYLPTGATAFALQIPWLAQTGALGALGALSLWERRSLHPVEENILDVGLLYLPGGAIWLASSRLGLELLGFPFLIVQLTGVHFHYAGFLAPVMTAALGRALRAHRPAWMTWYWPVAVIVAAGTPLIAIGINSSPIIEVISASIFALGLMAGSLLTLGLLGALASWPARLLLFASATSSFVSMIAAVLFAMRHITEVTPLGLTISQMAMLHGLTNCLGYAGAGIVGWALVRTPRHIDSSS